MSDMMDPRDFDRAREERDEELAILQGVEGATRRLCAAVEWLSFHPNDSNGWRDVQRAKIEAGDRIAALDAHRRSR